ncbi:hypothetical protein AOXY_G1646 [Acipenser oxyrinchus oxyrinchus]|uniref:Uncharacterized protein n=1 Tax=Acipenser oxyrinchus oxyrinchus TaxID=40147 RepID=A0AAD8LT61_ACIOX|nr:hypothetical protein AOXY_G1646 [Acipenser oxyrinchus oxyrinchus]
MQLLLLALEQKAIYFICKPEGVSLSISFTVEDEVGLSLNLSTVALGTESLLSGSPLIFSAAPGHTET